MMGKIIHEVEVWVLVDADGDYSAGNDAELATERYGDDVGGSLVGSRMVRVVLKVEMPAQVEITAELPALQGGVSLTAS